MTDIFFRIDIVFDGQKKEEKWAFFINICII